MNKQTIDHDEFQKWQNETETTYAYSHKERKKLTVTANGRYRMYVGKELLWDGSSRLSAVEIYNKFDKEFIPEPPSPEAKKLAIDFMLWTMSGDCLYTCEDEDMWKGIGGVDYYTTEELFEKYIKLRNAYSDGI